MIYELKNIIKKHYSVGLMRVLNAVFQIGVLWSVSTKFGSESTGNYALFISILLLSQVIVKFGSDHLIFKDHSGPWDKRDGSEINFLYFSLVNFIIFCPIFIFIFTKFFNQYELGDLLVTIILYNFVLLFSEIYRSKSKYVISIFSNNVILNLSIILLIHSHLVVNEYEIIKSIKYLLCFILICQIIGYKKQPNTNKRFSLDKTVRFYKRGSRYALTNIMATMFDFLPIYYIANFISLHEAGIFSILSTITQVLPFVGAIVFFKLPVVFSRCVKDSDFNLARKIYYENLILVIISSIILSTLIILFQYNLINFFKINLSGDILPLYILLAIRLVQGISIGSGTILIMIDKVNYLNNFQIFSNLFLIACLYNLVEITLVKVLIIVFLSTVLNKVSTIVTSYYLLRKK
ncbi:hypothetical protein N9Y58_01665 [Alphaproteobacteria bacterium]|nr:hypothetical protein [Alphaproteobacteria bacterium]